MKAFLFRAWIIITVLALGFTQHMAAQQPQQYPIRGKILDSASRQPVGYATITIFDPQGADKGSTYSLENGQFTIQAPERGTWTLLVSAVGFGNREQTIVIGPAASLADAGTLLLSTAAATMDEVTVTAARKLVQKKPGMLVYIAENDVTNKGGTAADVLRKAPVISLDAQGNVSMRGNSNIKILIDGKYSGQMARSVSDALNMMPADIIRAVEIITNPSAKYDAEGAAGVINIITKKGNRDFNGTIEVSAGNWEQMINPRLAFSRDKWSVTIHGHLHRLQSRYATRYDRQNFGNGSEASSIVQDITARNSAPHGSADITVIYAADSVSEFSLGINSWFGNWPDNRDLRTTVAQGAQITEQYRQSVTTRAGYLGSDINLGYNRKLKRPGSEITLLVQVSPSGDDSRYNALQTEEDNKFLYHEINNNKARNREFTAQADYVHPLTKNGKYVLETGLKAITRKVENTYSLQFAEASSANEYVEDPSRSDRFTYSQNVYAGYGLLKLNLSKGWYGEFGARLEQTALRGIFASNGNSFNNDFTNLIPTATVSRKFSEEHSVSASYTKRLTRPYIWDLNPNLNTSDPKNIMSGNPELQPEIAHQAELSYSWSPDKFFLNNSLFYRSTGNAIVDFVELADNGVSYTSKQNLAANSAYGLNLSATARITPLLNLNSNININYLDYTSEALQIFNDGWATEFNLNATQKIGSHYTVQAFGEFNTRKVNLQGYETRRYYYSFAAKREIPRHKLMVTVSIANPFSETFAQTEFINNSFFASSSRRLYYNRAFKLTLNWDFGKSFVGRERKKIQNDDIKVQGKG